MKKLALALLAPLCIGPAQAQPVGPQFIGCNKTASISATATTTKIVTEVGGLAVHICGYDVGAGAAAGGFQIITGTGATCGTATVNVTGAFTLAINQFVASRASYAQFSTPPGTAACVITTGTGPTTLTLYYGQF